MQNLTNKTGLLQLKILSFASPFEKHPVPNTLQYAHVHLSWIFPRNTRQIHQCSSKSRPTMTYCCKKPVEPQVVKSQIIILAFPDAFLRHSLGYPVYPGGYPCRFSNQKPPDLLHRSIASNALQLSLPRRPSMSWNQRSKVPNSILDSQIHNDGPWHHNFFLSSYHIHTHLIRSGSSTFWLCSWSKNRLQSLTQREVQYVQGHLPPCHFTSFHKVHKGHQNVHKSNAGLPKIRPFMFIWFIVRVKASQRTARLQQEAHQTPAIHWFQSVSTPDLLVCTSGGAKPANSSAWQRSHYHGFRY